MKILVVEDRNLIAQDIVDRLEQFSFTDIIGPFAKAEDALIACEDIPPDIALLDISLKGEMTGIQLAEALNVTRIVPVIYLTQHEDERILTEIMRTNAAYYLNKPFSNNELKMALHSAEKALSDRGEVDSLASEAVEILNDRIFIKNGRGKVCVMLTDILWIQSGGGDTSSVMTTDRLDKPVKSLLVIGCSLTKLLDKLSFYPKLVRCSRFYIVNLEKVERIIDSGKMKTRKSLIIAEESISVGDKYRKTVIGALRTF